MDGSEFRAIRTRLGLTLWTLGRAIGYSGNRNTVQVLVRKYESGERTPPPWIARLMIMFDRFGVPDDFKEHGDKDRHP